MREAAVPWCHQRRENDADLRRLSEPQHMTHVKGSEASILVSPWLETVTRTTQRVDSIKCGSRGGNETRTRARSNGKSRKPTSQGAQEGGVVGACRGALAGAPPPAVWQSGDLSLLTRSVATHRSRRSPCLRRSVIDIACHSKATLSKSVQQF